MILPNNGKVVVFDDKQKDIESLLKALSKEKIPFLYYQDETGSDLPADPVENVRLVFLDLELVVNNPTSHNIISTIAGRFRRVLTTNNVYVLLYWSTKEDKYRVDLENAFDNGLNEYKPIKIISLNKAHALADNDPIEYITKALRTEMRGFSSLIGFMLWESSVNDAAGRITNELTSFIMRKEVDKGMYGLLYRLSKEQAGAVAVADQDNNQKLNLAFELINNSLVETTERLFAERLPKVEIGDIKEGGRELQEGEKVILNTRLHILSSEHLQHFYSGNLYILENNGLAREIVLRNCEKSSHELLDTDTTKLICLDITPSCDYAQRKYYTRVIYGVKLKKEFKKNISRGDHGYKEHPIFEIDGESILIFDFRTVRSFTREEFSYRFSEKPRYRLRKSILLDIQAQLSNHINRPGIVNID